MTSMFVYFPQSKKLALLTISQESQNDNGLHKYAFRTDEDGIEVSSTQKL